MNCLSDARFMSKSPTMPMQYLDVLSPTLRLDTLLHLDGLSGTLCVSPTIHDLERIGGDACVGSTEWWDVVGRAKRGR